MALERVIASLLWPEMTKKFTLNLPEFTFTYSSIPLSLTPCDTAFGGLTSRNVNVIG